MPTKQAERELMDAGYRPQGESKCPKCNCAVDVWESPRGNKIAWNPATHPTAPLMFHHLTCGEEADLKKLQGEQ
jgi:hypothetical protein